jgi:hypothetical protein
MPKKEVRCIVCGLEVTREGEAGDIWLREYRMGASILHQDEHSLNYEFDTNSLQYIALVLAHISLTLQ